MSTRHIGEWAALAVRLAAGLATALAVAGCGTPGAPQPPSLMLPDRVSDLSAVRTGDQVSLAWTMPKRNTDKLLLKGDVTVHVCRAEGAGACEPAGADLAVAPGARGTFTETLPGALAAGAARPLRYFVELRNARGRSAGLSNAAVALAGQAPVAIAGLSAENRKDGVALHWTALKQEQPDGPATAVRLHRTLLGAPPAKHTQGLLEAPAEPAELNLLVEAPARPRAPLDGALDKSIRQGQRYEYRLQRITRLTVDGKTLELASAPSAPLQVDALDVFPPDTPTAVAAVAILSESGGEPAIDLSWQPVADADLAGYALYRREGEGPWLRISPPQPLVPPAFHDGHVQAGHAYIYAVTAIDQGGHESPRSVEARETVPNP